MNFYEAIKNRRTNYAITNNSTISNEKIEEILKEAITSVPSAFNSQSSRVALLLGAKNTKLWSIVKETLRKIVPAQHFQKTEEKINSFASGYGTILFFEDMKNIKEMQKNFPSYAENFPVWSNQSSGMLQFAVWTALCSEGLGVSLQHYNPIIDEQVAQEFGLNSDWKLIAQMPFGTAASKPPAVEKMPVQDRLIVQGDKL